MSKDKTVEVECDNDNCIMQMGGHHTHERPAVLKMSVADKSALRDKMGKF